MKKSINSVLLICSVSLLSFVSTSVMANDGRIGDIRYSILSENQSQQLHSKDWELLRGQEVPWNSELKNFWRDPHLPDARGVFLRSANHGRPRNEGNPEGALPIGEYRTDEIVMHSHPHSHTWASEHSGFA